MCVFTAAAAVPARAQEIEIRDGRTTTVKGSGDRVAKTYKMPDFTGIRAGSGIRVEVSRGDKSVEVKSDSKALDYLKVEVSGGVLKVGYRNNVNVRNVSTTFYISIPELTYLEAGSGSTVRLKDEFRGDKLTADTSSAGSITGDVYYSEIKVVASSGGTVRLSGKADSGKVSVSSGGSVNLLEMPVGTMDVSASSGGVLRVNATEKLTGSSSSGGSVKFAGDPKNIDVRKSSGGSVSMLR